MRKKKTPEELAAEAEQEDLDDFTSNYPIFFLLFIQEKYIRYSMDCELIQLS